MKLIYIAGPYRARTKDEVGLNITSARLRGAEVVKALGAQGLFPVIPHLNTAHFDIDPYLADVSVPDEYYLEGTMELLRRSDAVLLTRPDAAELSGGTRAELKEAGRLRIPVFYSLADLKEWAARENRK